MKKITLFKCMVVLTMLLPMGAKAQVKDLPPVLRQADRGMMESMIIDQQNYRKTEKDNMTILSYNKPIPKREASNDDAQVHFVLDYDKEGVEVTGVYLYMFHNQQWYGTYQWDFDDDFEPVLPMGDDFTMTLPKGEWDFCLWLRNDITRRWEHIFQDLVQIDGDMTLTFSEETATNHISFKQLMPDGKEMVFSQFQVNKAGEVEVVSRGDVDQLYVSSNLLYKPEGPRGGICSLGGERLNIEGYYNVSDLDWWVSESKSGRFAFCRGEFASDGNQFEMNESSAFYVNKFYTDKTETAVLTNNPANYFYTEEKFIPSKAGKETGGQVSIENPYVPGSVIIRYPTGGFQMGLYDVINGCYLGVMAKQSIWWKDADATIHLYNCVSESDATSDIRYDVQVVPSFVDNWQPSQWGSGAESRCIYGLPAYRINGKATYVNRGVSLRAGTTLFSTLPNSNTASLEGNPAFSFSPEQKVLDYGSSCPILSLEKLNYEAEWGQWFVAYPYYIGRYGEYRETDMVTLEETIKVDGEQVAGSYSEYEQLRGQWSGEGIPTGVFDISLVNKNVEVDGLDAKNEATIHFDMGADDKEAPSLQMLWFKDKDNKIVDRFAKAEDGTLEFAGGDFNFHFVSEQSMWYDIAEQMVAVSYSPYNKNEWAALEVEEIPENFFMPGFGYFYRGSLKDVEGQGEKGWFDLKIRLEDAAGNWQEQVISPAFRIDDLVDTGIENNNQYTTTNKQEVYDLMGRCIGNNLSTSNKGISIVRRANGDVRKVVNK